MKTIGIDENIDIICDYARPEIIQDLKNNGYQAKNANKNVVEGIRTVKQFNIKAFEDKELIKEYNNYQWKKQGDKIIDEPVKMLDDCFVGSTLITTDKGDIPIVDIKEGDMVLTSNGYRKVLHKYHNGKKLVKDYSLLYDTEVVKLTCTNNHKFKTTEKWIEISKLESGMTTFHTKPSMVKLTNYTVEEDTSLNTNTICTNKFGNFTMVKEEKGTIFTTLMETLGITELKTWKKLKQTNTYLNIQKKDLRTVKNGLRIFNQKGLKLQNLGINHQKELNGTDKMLLILTLENRLMERENAKCVEQGLQPIHKIKNFVQTNVNPNIEEIVELIMKQESVKYVQMNSLSTNIQKQKLVDVKSCNERYEDTYDLMVEETHEFFANGILVHNCMDAIRYGIMYIKLQIENSTPMLFF